MLSQKIFKNINLKEDKIEEYNSQLKIAVTAYLTENKQELPTNKLVKITGLMYKIGLKYHNNEKLETNKTNMVKQLLGLSLDEPTCFIKPVCDTQIIKEYYQSYFNISPSDPITMDFISSEDSVEISQITFYRVLDKKYGKKTDIYGCSYSLLKLSLSIHSIIINLLEQILNSSEKINEIFKPLALAKFSPKLKPRYIESGDRSDLRLFRPLSTIPIMSKMLDSMMAIKLREFYEGKIDPCQTLYTKNSIFRATNTICHDVFHMKNTNKYPVKCLLFMDIKEAYCNVNYHKLLDILIKDKVPQYIIRYVFNFLTNLNGYINDKNDTFQVNKGLLMGQPCSQILFIIYMNSYIQKINKYSAISQFVATSNSGLLKTWMIAYVDDLVFRIVSQHQLDLLFFMLPNINKEFGLEFNKTKSRKLLSKLSKMNVIYEGEEIKDVELGFKYLGGLIYHDPNKLYKYMVEELIMKKMNEIEIKAKNEKHFLALCIKNVINNIGLKIQKSSIDPDPSLLEYMIKYILYYLDKNNIKNSEMIAKYIKYSIISKYMQKCLGSNINVGTDNTYQKLESIKNKLIKASQKLSEETKTILTIKYFSNKKCYDLIF